MRTQFSLRQLLLTVLLGAALTGLTCEMYSGGATPATRTVRAYRQAPLRADEPCWGNMHFFGFPCVATTIQESWSQEDWDNSYERRIQRRPLGLCINLIFWMAAVAGTIRLLGFFRRQRARASTQAALSPLPRGERADVNGVNAG